MVPILTSNPSLSSVRISYQLLNIWTWMSNRLACRTQKLNFPLIPKLTLPCVLPILFKVTIIGQVTQARHISLGPTPPSNSLLTGYDWVNLGQFAQHALFLSARGKPLSHHAKAMGPSIPHQYTRSKHLIQAGSWTWDRRELEFHVIQWWKQQGTSLESLEVTFPTTQRN